MKRILTSIAWASLAASAGAQEPRALTAEGPKGELAGTLIPPASGQAVVLIVPGSGPTDRDGNNPMGIIAASYRLLAEALAERGIGSVRIDKRGMFGSKAAIPDPNDVTIADYARDVHAWIKSARSETGAQCIWLLGHSEGGLVALEAAQNAKDVCGVMLVASVGRPFGEILREQLSANPANAPILDQALSAITELEAGRRVSASDLHPALKGLFAPAVQGFLIDAMTRDPASLGASLEVPTLIVSGGKDLQTPVADGEALAKALPAARFAVIPDMNHVLKAVAGDTRGANLATYADPSLPVHPELAETIAQFVSAKPD